MISRLFGRILRGEEGNIFGEENEDLKKRGGKEYPVVGNFIHP